ncbi:peptidylprolyl isomerase [Niabella digestorum]|uniref:Periplasmic chaperone PpiD n=1 Tax=Niabella digestorum TaxID=3117701 RepID=A0ABU7RHD2_9BACT
MSIIQKIQDQYAKVMAVIIAIALIVFVIMLAFENGGTLFRGDVTTVGKVNGEVIDYDRFRIQVEQQTMMLQQRGMGSGEAVSQQALEQAWNGEIARILLNQETGKLGIDVGKKELNDILFGSNPPQELLQAFQDPQTGRYNPALAQQQINQIKTKGTEEQKAQLNAFLEQMAFQRLAEKFDALFTTSINFPKWMIEKENAQNSLLSKISFVREPYSSIPDSTVKVTNEDIQKYIDKHKEEFKQTESRSISYVAFNAEPSAADSAQIRESLLALKPAFDSVTDVKAFLRNQGVNNYYDGYISANRIQVPMKDSIFKVGIGNIYGPYIDAGNYVLAKVVAQRNIPDTVKIRHILVGTMQMDPQTGQQIPIRDDSTAKKLADSIALAIRNGANFDSLVVKFSNDLGSVNNGGVYDGVPSGQMVPEFNDFIFTNPVGAKGVVKTDYGYHYIEILSQKGSSTGYKIAYLNKPIEASAETDMAANSQATKFAAQVKDRKSFEEAADKLQKEKGVYRSVAQDIAPTASFVPGLGASRTFVKSIYNAKLGEIVQPERVGDYYVVAIVTEVNKEGTMSVDKARFMVEPLLINQKKAELISQKIGKITTLEAVAEKLKKPIEVADSLRFSGQFAQSIGFEPKVIGAAFNKENVNKVVNEPIAGTQGVYVVRIDNLTATPVEAANVEETRKMRYMQGKQQAQYQTFQALKEAASIKDYRAKFY